MHQQLVLAVSGKHADLVGRRLPCCRLDSAAFDSRLGKSDVIVGPDGACPARLHQLQELCQLGIICRAQHHRFRWLQEKTMGHHIAVYQEDELISLKSKTDGLWMPQSVRNNVCRGPHKTGEEIMQNSCVLT